LDAIKKLRPQNHSLEAATDETLGIEDGVAGVHGSLVLGGITNETLIGGERNVGGGSAVTLC